MVKIKKEAGHHITREIAKTSKIITLQLYSLNNYAYYFLVILNYNKFRNPDETPK